jgi:hypothetical protein
MSTAAQFRYTAVMGIRAGLIVWLALVYATAPLALDACARSCASAVPTCHQAPSGSTHLGHAPVLCAHDHTIVRPATVDRESGAAASVTPAIVTAETVAVAHALERRLHDPGGPPPPSPPSLAAAPLRV